MLTLCQVVLDYIQGRVEKAGVRKYVQFNTVVDDVEYNQETGKFTVISTLTAMDPKNPISRFGSMAKQRSITLHIF